MSIDSIADIVRRGLCGRIKRLPPFLFYDRAGSDLFERITELPEYYVTRTESDILRTRADAIAAAAVRAAGGPVTVLELGAGTATKTELLLGALLRRNGVRCFMPADVSPTPLQIARERLATTLPELVVTPFVGDHEASLAHARKAHGPLLVLFIGSSIGNYDPPDAAALLGQVRTALGARGVFLLGADLRKPLALLIPAYDDAAGVTAAFNRNVLVRINRELGGHFDPTSFRHVALWNEQTSAVEMHLESLHAQRVHIDALGVDVVFAAGERIHTESSHKYDRATLDRMLGAAGMASTLSLCDPAGLYALHLATPRAAGVYVANSASR